MLREYGAERRLRLPRATVERLRSTSEDWRQRLGLPRHKRPLIVRRLEGGRVALKAQGVTGLLQVDHLLVEVVPKFLAEGIALPPDWRRALWKILSVVQEAPELGEAVEAHATASDTAWDLMGHLLAEGITRALRAGLPRGYLERRASLPVLRGRLDMSALAQLATQPHRLPCVFDSYEENTPLNRLLRWSTWTLASLVGAPGLARRLGELDLALAGLGVSRVPPGLPEAERLRLPPQQTDLIRSLRVSRLLLRWLSLAHGPGGEAAPGFLWNSHDVFEDYTKHLIGRVVGGRSSWTWTDRKATLARAVEKHGSIATLPDIRVLEDEQHLFVLDAKYKTWKKHPSSSNAYQVIAGGKIANCVRVGLLYPGNEADASQTRGLWAVEGAGNPKWLAAIFIDLMRVAEPQGEDQLVRRLASDLDWLATRA